MIPDIFGENPNFGFPTLDPWLGPEGFTKGPQGAFAKGQNMPFLDFWQPIPP